MQQWFDSPAGRYLLGWEQAAFDESVADIFGYHAIQLGLPAVEALRANRMPHRWLGLEHGATPRAIKRAYWRLAKAHHPDLGGDPEAFHRLDAAYRLLVG